MTDATVPSAHPESAPPIPGPEPLPRSEPTTAATGRPPRDGRVVIDVLALTTLAAGLVHLPVAVAHGADTLVGGGMLATGFVQALLSLLVWLQPSRWTVVGTVAVNAGAALVLALAHTTGLPVSGLEDPEAFSAQAVAVLGLEAAAALAGLFGLASVTGPVRARRWVVPVAAAAVLAVAVPAGATGGSHMHDHGAGGHGGDEEHADGHVGGVPTDRYAAFTTGMAQPDIDAALASEVDWIVDHIMANGDGGSSREKIEPIVAAGVLEAVSNGEGNGGHGHSGLSPWEPVADPATRDVLATQLDQSRQAALALPTAADATAAGYVQVTQYLPGIGAHYVKIEYALDSTLDATKPEILLYSGNGPDAAVVGVSYLELGGAEDKPAGLAGPNDVWHFHEGLCNVARMVVPVPEPAGESCAAVGGKQRNIGGGPDTQKLWMMHAWVVPGWESPWGLFSSENPELTLAVGETPQQA